jgi:hypothetical protein
LNTDRGCDCCCGADCVVGVAVEAMRTVLSTMA